MYLMICGKERSCTISLRIHAFANIVFPLIEAYTGTIDENVSKNTVFAH